jgi:hypothetical protein
VLVLAASLALPILCGCGDDVAAPVSEHANSHVQALPASVPIANPSSGALAGGGGNADEVGSSPSVPAASPTAQEDPLLAGTTGLDHGSGGLAAGGESLDTGKSSLIRGHSEDQGKGQLASVGRTKDWYWIRGSIDNGEIDIAVNGVPIGRWSVHVDKEITPFCHPGENQISFTQHPYQSDQPVAAHLHVVASQQDPGAPPLATYDVPAENQPSPTSPVAPSSAPPPDTRTFTGE